MQRLLASFFACMLLASCSEDSALPDVEWPEASPALWKIENPEGQHGYMFGTMHALPDGVNWRTPVFDAALENAKIVFVEIADLDDGSAATQAFAELAYSDGLPPLLQRLDTADRQTAAALLDSVGAEEGDFAEIENWAVAMTLSASVRIGEPGNGVDRTIIDSGKPLHGLENFRAQFAIFDELTDEEQAQLLAAIVREAGKEKQIAATSAWLSGDLNALARLGEEGIMGNAGLRRVLVDDRNNAWAEQFARSVEQGQTPMIAVGAGHMLGASGLPALMEERGYLVTRLQ